MPLRLLSYALLPMLIAACTAKSDAPGKSDTGSQATAAAPGSATDPDAVRRVIDSLQARFVVAADRGDVDAIVSDYAADAIVLRADQPVGHGVDAVRKAYGETSLKGNKVNTQDVLVSGDLAVETGIYEVTHAPKGGSERKETGKYVMVWQRQPGGSWKGVRDAVITDAPAKK